MYYNNYTKQNISDAEYQTYSPSYRKYCKKIGGDDDINAVEGALLVGATIGLKTVKTILNPFGFL